MSKDKKINIDIPLYIEGMGIVFYSFDAVKNIREGEDFLEQEYYDPDKVAKHIKKGDIVGFCTGSSGDYILKFREGRQTRKIDTSFQISIELAIVIKGGKLYIRDLFDLMDWTSKCDETQQIPLEDGIYDIILNTRIPESGIYGDYQEIYVFINKSNIMPDLQWEGVPQLFKEI